MVWGRNIGEREGEREREREREGAQERQEVVRDSSTLYPQSHTIKSVYLNWYFKQPLCCSHEQFVWVSQGTPKCIFVRCTYLIKHWLAHAPMHTSTNTRITGTKNTLNHCALFCLLTRKPVTRLVVGLGNQYATGQP